MFGKPSEKVLLRLELHDVRNTLARERRESEAEIERTKRQYDEERSRRYDTEYEVRRLQSEVERLNRMMTLKPKTYAVAPRSGTDEKVIADDHKVAPEHKSGQGVPVLELYLQGDLVASYPAYTSFKIVEGDDDV